MSIWDDIKNDAESGYDDFKHDTTKAWEAAHAGYDAWQDTALGRAFAQIGDEILDDFADA
eukprot:CAMPEP_0113899968 /NCGR_PEP_ID=MMETSP0780_2-20120614/20384_1 /TAXON_ID=652834 /ORGANISM="Palpitomonas bilix" /LENGTH=59 /DNA_ID=CAMNT_0000892311 /DNA_START=360 /DNA_END=539 /DNA_ORIENTATION=+ /assembly_acc=CAM_ASM_000599